MLGENLTIIQNFIITNDVKLKHLKSDVGLSATAKIFDECKIVVNYKTDLYLDEIRTLYEQYFPKVEFYNIKEDENFSWGKTTKFLAEKTDTPYLYYLTEDRMFHVADKQDYENMLTDVIDADAGIVSMGKLWKYGMSVYPSILEQWNLPPYMDNHDNIFTWYTKNTPSGIVGVDAIFRRDILFILLQRTAEIENKYIHTKNKPHVIEHDNGGWFKKMYPDLIWAVPKKEIVVSDDDPGHNLITG